MIDHLSSYTCNYGSSKAFYEQVFKPLGISLTQELTANWNKTFPTQRMCAFGPKEQSIFWLVEVKDTATPRHIAFSADKRSVVNDFYESAITHGGKDNGKPGLRKHYHDNYYGAFVIDLDGNNIEAVCHKPE